MCDGLMEFPCYYLFFFAARLFLCRFHIVLIVTVNIPPVIIDGPEKTIPFVIGESIEVKCVASGRPDPV